MKGNKIIYYIVIMKIIEDFLSEITTEMLIQELISRDGVKELTYTYNDYINVSGINEKCKLSYETKGPVRILILEEL